LGDLLVIRSVALRAARAVADALGPIETERPDAKGRWRPWKGGAIRLRQAQALALRRLGATWEEVADTLGLTRPGAVAAAGRGSALEGRDPAVAAALTAAGAGVATPGEAPPSGRRGRFDTRGASRRRQPEGFAPLAEVRVDLAVVARSLAGSRWCLADADDAVQEAAVWAWHSGVGVPARPGGAAAALRRWALRRLLHPRLRAAQAAHLNELPPGLPSDIPSPLALLEVEVEAAGDWVSLEAVDALRGAWGLAPRRQLDGPAATC
jgi:DNA-directed RNA polymerase specialized sigma24 family protein